VSTANTLKAFFKSIGLNCKVEKQFLETIITAADNHNLDFTWNKEGHTGIFLYYYPLFKVSTSFDNPKYLIHINSIVIKKEDRGKGLGRQIVETLIETFGDSLYAIEYSDLSNGFWNHMKELFPETKFINLESESH
jgi:predicted GNAT family acetyltransferase